MKQTEVTISHRKRTLSIKSKLYLQFKCKTWFLCLRVCVCTLTKVCLSVGVVIFLCSIRLNGLSVFLDGAGQDKLTASYTNKHRSTHTYTNTYTQALVCTVPQRPMHTQLPNNNHTHIYRNTRGSHTLADGLSDSLYSGLK